GAGEGDEAVVLGFVADGAPARVVAELFATAGVAAGGLQVAVGARADPDVGPRRRDDEGADALEVGGAADGLAVGAEVAERFAAPHAADAGCVVARVPQPRRLRRPHGVLARRRALSHVVPPLS